MYEASPEPCRPAARHRLTSITVSSGVLEKNLDRLTVITSVVFGVTILIMTLTFPLGTV